MTPFATQYTALLLDLEQLDHHMQKIRKVTDHDDALQDTCHCPMQFGGHGATDTIPDGAQAA